MLSHTFGSFLGAARARLNISRVMLILFSTLLILITCAVPAQEDVQNLAVVVNGLANPELGISSSLSIIDLDEPDLRKAVENEIIPLGSAPNDIQVQNNLGYVVNTFSDNIQIIDLRNRVSLGEIPIGPGTLPEKIAFVNDNNAYVTCNGTDEVRVVDLTQRRVVKTIAVGSAPWGVAVLNGKAYVTNSAAIFDPVAVQVNYGDSTLTVIDTGTDTVLKTIPMPLNARDITIDSELRVLVLSTGDFGLTPGSLVVINGDIDEIEKTIKLRVTPSHTLLVDSRGRVYVGSFGGMLVYDLISEKFIHDRNDVLEEFGAGFGMAIDPRDNVYVTIPDWSGAKLDELRVMAPNKTLLKTYSVGAGASFVAIAQIQSLPTSVNPRGKLITRWGKIKSKN